MRDYELGGDGALCRLDGQCGDRLIGIRCHWVSKVSIEPREKEMVERYRLDISNRHDDARIGIVTDLSCDVLAPYLESALDAERGAWLNLVFIVKRLAQPTYLRDGELGRCWRAYNVCFFYLQADRQCCSARVKLILRTCQSAA